MKLLESILSFLSDYKSLILISIVLVLAFVTAIILFRYKFKIALVESKAKVVDCYVRLIDRLLINSDNEKQREHEIHLKELELTDSREQRLHDKEMKLLDNQNLREHREHEKEMKQTEANTKAMNRNKELERDALIIEASDKFFDQNRNDNDSIAQG